MTGRRGTRPATTPPGHNSCALLAPHAENQAIRGPRFEAMERMFGKAEKPQSDAAGPHVRRDRSRRQVCGIPHPVHAAVDGRRPRRAARAARSAIFSTRPAIFAGECIRKPNRG